MNTGSHRGIDVSVVVPAYNCRAHLDRCLTSLLVQGVSKQIIVVDGGSWDGGAALLDLYAAHHPRSITVIRQPQPGTAGGARNRGLAAATGRYVFFCDADGHLGPDALRRMVATADRTGADVVLGKIVGDPRGGPDTVYGENADHLALGDGPAYEDLTCFKLFRRETLTRHGIRFDETLRTGADLLFAVHAYCHAGAVSIVADHDCYHVGGRGDRDVLPGDPGGRDPLAWLRAVRLPIELMSRHVPPGPLRDRLLLRHFRRDVLTQLGAPFLAAGEGDREKIAVEVADICAQWLTAGVRVSLDDSETARVAALDDPDRLVRLARVEAAALCHRLTGLEWDGDRLAVAAQVRLAGLRGEPGLLLRERTTGEERRPPVTRVADLVSAAVDVVSLPPGVWDVHGVVECEGARRAVRLGPVRDAAVRAPAPRLAGGVVIVPFLTGSDGRLSVDVGGHVVRVAGAARLTRTEWRRRRLRIEGEVRVAKAPAAAAVRHLVWRERSSGQERRETVEVTGPQSFAAESGGLRPGTWDAYVELGLGGPPVRLAVKVGGPDLLERPLRWWRGPVRWTARPYATAVNRKLSVSVRPATPLTLMRRTLRALRRR
ncbi:glycosyltransferase family 2 protein [Microbispora sp. RL4-1S]|uniref:Glycosyltransferase family 2 protein n=1 Tax=Microbispora oryzae TaxID=2806554 RepID=A0A940WL50_9ACTN|nr:glycosyltransferase family 2 protein [Microbispora oryzae]MBP2704928.1 glycosyltransferase family 2 protein [Microbispora oryzae]